MNTLQGKRRAYVVINILTKVQIGAFRSINFRKARIDFEFQIVQASVTGHRNSAAYAAFNIYSSSVVD